MSVSQETICKCGKTKYWLVENEITKSSCPECGRRYRGKYDHKTLGIKAVEVKGENDESERIKSKSVHE